MGYVRRIYDRLADSFAMRAAARVQLAERYSPATKASLRRLFLAYQTAVRSGCAPRLADTGVRVFSEYEEDGQIMFLLAACGIGPETFIDIGAGDGIGGNTANLAVNFGFHGLMIDGGPQIYRGREFYAGHPDTKMYPPTLLREMVTRENVNDLIEGAGFSGDVDVLSIDIDGNDYWIWDAIEVVSPRIVVIETHVEFGTRPIVVPYDPDYVFPGEHPVYSGASVTAMAKLSRKLGYRMVGSNQLGFNTFHVRNDLAEMVPEVSAEHVLRHARNAEVAELFDEVADMEYVRA